MRTHLFLKPTLRILVLNIDVLTYPSLAAAVMYQQVMGE